MVLYFRRAIRKHASLGGWLLFGALVNPSFLFAAETLRIMSYNVWGAPFAGKKANQRIPEIARRLATLDADIVGLQEVFEGCFVRNQTKMILKGSRFPYYAKGPSAKFLIPCVNSGLVTLSRHPIVKTVRMSFDACKGFDCFSRKGILLTRIRVPNIGEVDVYNTHFNAGGGNSAVRDFQSLRAIDFVTRHSGEGNRPVFMLGDINAIPLSQEMIYLRTLLNFRDSHEEYFEGRKAAPVARNGYTCDPSRNTRHRGRPDQSSRRLDYILMRDSVHSASPMQVIDSHLVFDAPDFKKGSLSDHFGVYAAFRWE
jgi:endonuclease/exonuclease/phosphatase family metal-dependent hydrolase